MMAGLREALESAFEQSEPTEEIPSSAPPTDDTAPSGDVTSTETTATPTTEPELTAEEQRARDALGRFTKADQVDGKGKTPPTAEKPPTEPLKGPQLTLAAGTPKFEPPPRGVPPTLRSHWTGLTPEWRAHIAETHNKLGEVEQQYQPAVQFTQRFLQTIQPFQHAIQAETGGDAIAAVRGLMDTATKLRFGTPVEKAQTAAAIVKAYGIDINALDEALVGVTPAQPAGVDPNMVQNAVQQALAPLMQQVQQRRAQTEQEVATQTEKEIATFAADPKNEFFEDVRNLMADMMEVAERQKQTLSLADAYTRACWLHPDVSKVMLARQQGQSAQSLTQAAQRAKAAAVSVKGSAPVGNPAPSEPSSVRDAIEQAIEVHSRV
jgi:hypothetical protein